MPKTEEAHGWRFTVMEEDGLVTIDNKPTIEQARLDGRVHPQLQMCVVPLPLIHTIHASTSNQVKV